MRQVGRSEMRGPSSKIRGLGLGTALVAVTLALTLGPAASAQVASLKAPNSVSAGKEITLRVQGFPPRSTVVFVASLDGPAALSGRRLGLTRTDSSGRATFRTRFPSTYQWCDADRKCTTYRWPDDARIALSAAAEGPPSTSVREVVPLRKHRQKGGKYRRCGGKVRLSAGDLATRIKARHMSCREAKKAIKAPATKRGYRCKTTKRGGLPHITCTKGRKAVKFTYIQY